MTDLGYNQGWRVDQHPRFVADVTGDGKADIVGFGGAGVYVAVSNGDGTFQPARRVLDEFRGSSRGWSVDRHPRFVADVTGDGKADIVGFGDAGVYVAVSNGDGTFQAVRRVVDNFGTQQGWRVDQHPRFVADVTGDGKADIVGFGDAGVYVAVSNGDGTFQAARRVVDNFGTQQGWRVDQHPRFVADVTGDGKADIVGFGDAGVYVAVSNGDGTFQAARRVVDNFGVQQGWRVDQHPRFVADVTGDGKADIVGFGDAGVYVAVSNGDGTFQPARRVLDNLGTQQGWSVDRHPRFVADVTGDGKADIVGFGNAGVYVAVSNGDGTFQPARLALADFGLAVSCLYPQSNQTSRTIIDELRAVAANRAQGSSFYLDTLESQSHDELPLGIDTEGEDHHQGLARTHQLSDGSIFFFLSHSETDAGDKGNLMQFRYSGPTDGEHIVSTDPLTVAPMMPLTVPLTHRVLETEEQHPCDMVFLRDINNADAGYLFLVEQKTHRLGIYHWVPSMPLEFRGYIQVDEHHPGGPNFVFLDLVGDRYYLGIAYVDANNVGQVKLYTAEPSALFKGCVPGVMDVSAFQPTSPDSIFPFPVSKDASQVHLVRDVSGKFFLLAFRGDPPDKEDATDFIDIHEVEFSPFSIKPKLDSIHIFLPEGKTSFASTGTHYVDNAGRLLISSSYRWSEDEGPEIQVSSVA